jgi:hypothetical protein
MEFELKNNNTEIYHDETLIAYIDLGKWIFPKYIDIDMFIEVNNYIQDNKLSLLK